MNLIENVDKLIKERNVVYLEKRWNHLCKSLEENISKENSLDILICALHLDSNDVLPFEQKKMLFEKILSIQKSRKMLRSFAFWLKLNGGPDWYELVESLLIESDEL